MDKSEDTKQPIVNIQQSPDMSFMDYIQKTLKDKSKIDVLLELLNPEKKRLTTEWPNSNYTKWGVKIKSWSYDVGQVLHLDDGYRFENGKMVYHVEFDETEQLTKQMHEEAEIHMISHKRRRAQEIVTALKDDNNNIYSQEGKLKKSFLGIR